MFKKLIIAFAILQAVLLAAGIFVFIAYQNSRILLTDDPVLYMGSYVKGQLTNNQNIEPCLQLYAKIKPIPLCWPVSTERCAICITFTSFSTGKIWF